MPLSSSVLSRKFNDGVREVVGDPLLYAPSLALSVIKDGKILFRWRVGDHYRFYDLASLTKILFSAPVWMRIVQDSSLSLYDKARTYLPWWSKAGDVTVKGLLTHSAGLDWWKPYYSLIGDGHAHEAAWSKLKNLLQKEEPNLSIQNSVYSDLDLFYLGFIAEELFQKSLPEIWEDVRERMDFKDLHFQDKERSKHNSSLYAPTGFSEWRKRDLEGEVHDDNAAALGGIAPHAGLFGTLEDVERYLIGLRKILREEDGPVFHSKTLKQFTQRQTHQSDGDFGLIFMKPTSGSSSSGQFFDDSSFGHTGFTGTSLWYSPKSDFGVILLSNRVYYGSDVEFFRHFRPLVHDLAYELVMSV